ncbi:hypothetical protein HO173_011577 [Letharia columbiana]|uniref:Autophagy-related protein 16 domain-containing protein n=1 Tax=Letharia columbiana TaxID=112416 RepID=A0A8H6FJ08_9LECA|nr:uncharacterized protein HO173_011577 [Letharia columbiana]KAF6229450.1 hypothetical protein HO173_011577 [Letharia columbiana]
MPSWRDDYLSALHERDKKEKANEAVYNRYAKLADRTATLQAARSAEVTRLQEEPRSSPNPKDRKISREKAVLGSPTTGDTITKVRQDLSEAQRSRGFDGGQAPERHRGVAEAENTIVIGQQTYWRAFEGESDVDYGDEGQR